jgi:hypothetical protein
VTAQDVQARQESLGPALRRAAVFNCQMEHRHGATASPVQLLRLPLLVGSEYPPWHYCQRCFTIFDGDGREVICAK